MIAAKMLDIAAHPLVTIATITSVLSIISPLITRVFSIVIIAWLERDLRDNSCYDWGVLILSIPFGLVGDGHGLTAMPFPFTLGRFQALE